MRDKTGDSAISEGFVSWEAAFLDDFSVDQLVEPSLPQMVELLRSGRDTEEPSREFELTALAIRWCRPTETTAERQDCPGRRRD